MGYREVTWAHAVKINGITVPGKPSITAASMKSVLVALADCQNTKTGQCNPSQDTLARATALSVSTVNRALSGLILLGYVSRTRNPIGGGGRYADSYLLHTELRTSQTANIAEEADEPRNSDGRTSQTATLAPIDKPGIENREITKRAREQRDSMFELAWKHWPRTDSKKRAREKFHRLNAEQVIDVARAIVAHGDAHARYTPKEFVPHLVTWLNGERWNDPLPQPRTDGRTTTGDRNLAYLANLAQRENGPQEISA